MRNWSLRQIYLYLVSFTGLVLLIIGMIRSVMAFGEFLMPNAYYIPGPAEVYSRYKTPEGKEIVPKEVVEEQIKFEADRAKEQSRSFAYNELRRGLAYVVVALPVWLYHWRKIQAEAKHHAGPANPPSPRAPGETTDPAHPG